MPPAIGEAIVKKYRKTGSPAVVDYKTYPGRTHRLVSQDGWEEIADYALEWATTHASVTALIPAALGPYRETCNRTSETAGIPQSLDVRLLSRACRSAVVEPAQGGDDIGVPAPGSRQRRR